MESLHDFDTNRDVSVNSTLIPSACQRPSDDHQNTPDPLVEHLRANQGTRVINYTPLSGKDEHHLVWFNSGARFG